MNQKPEEISNIIKEQIKQYRSRIEMTETGTVILVGDGIARVYGLRNCMASELLEFEDGSFGLAQNLEEETVSVALLSDRNDIREGTSVRRTGRVLSRAGGRGPAGARRERPGVPIDGRARRIARRRGRLRRRPPVLSSVKACRCPSRPGSRPSTA